MFAVIYRAYLKPGCETDYLKAWKEVATYFKQQRGSLGSCLHKTEDGMWVAYSRWSDKKTRDASWPVNDETVTSELPKEIRASILPIKHAIDENHKFDEICMEVIEDFL